MIEKFTPILLDIWREACQHIEIEQSTTTISNLLLQRLPLDQIYVCRLNEEKQSLEKVAVGFPEKQEELMLSRSGFYETEWETLINWHELHTPLLGTDSSSDTLISLILKKPGANDIMLSPLGESVRGILIFLSKPNQRFKSLHQEMFVRLIEPFSVALDNDARLQELSRLRHTAEADKKSLLQRLSRKAIGDTIIGADAGLAGVMNRVELVAASDVPVMLLGETGTGKELISREIHRRSPQAQGPFISVNCGAIPSELIDSHLFGHEKGAFTGAASMHQGYFERAHDGTLFLDEIGELPLAGQVRLLRILQDGWLERVGSKQPIHVRVRVIVATHRDLADMVRQGQFREDLWYRLSVFPIILPALRERPRDIPALADHFAERAAIRFQLPLQMLTPADKQLLKSYDWPGNVRELGSVINRAAILGNGDGLRVHQALGWLDQDAEKQSRSQPSDEKQILPLESVIRQHIESALTQTRGCIEGTNGAAELLDMHPNTLRSRMRKLGMRPGNFRR